MARTDFKIDGVQIKTPHDFQIQKYRITDSNRTANGDMVMDEIAKKRKFFFSYIVITGTEWAIINEALFEGDVFTELSYVEDNVTKTATVYMGALDKGRLHITGGEWVWKGASFNLIER